MRASRATASRPFGNGRAGWIFDIEQTANAPNNGIEELLHIFFDVTETSRTLGREYVQRAFSRKEGRDKPTGPEVARARLPLPVPNRVRRPRQRLSSTPEPGHMYLNCADTVRRAQSPLPVTEVAPTQTGAASMRLAVDAVGVDALFHASVPGLSAAGDVSTEALPSVANAVAAGSSAAAMIVQGLMAEAHGLAPVGVAHTARSTPRCAG